MKYKPMMTIEEFSAMNKARSEAPHGFNHKLESWSLSDWLTATMGELGEAANIVKKLNRVRDGVRGNDDGEEEGMLREKLLRELADTYIYLDLMIQAVGAEPAAAVLITFNRKSKQIGYTPKAPKPTKCRINKKEFFKP